MLTTKLMENRNTNIKATVIQDPKARLSALWLFAMLTYTYGDVVTLMDPLKHGSIKLTEGFLLGASIYMMIPISMVLFSRLLNYHASRWASIIAGTIWRLFDSSTTTNLYKCSLIYTWRTT